MLTQNSGVFHTFNGVYAVNAHVGFSSNHFQIENIFLDVPHVSFLSENFRLKLSEEGQLEGQVCHPSFACVAFSSSCISTHMVVFVTQTCVGRIHGKSAS